MESGAEVSSRPRPWRGGGFDTRLAALAATQPPGNADSLRSPQLSHRNADSLRSPQLSHRNADSLRSPQLSHRNADSLRSPQLSHRNADSVRSPLLGRRGIRTTTRIPRNYTESILCSCEFCV
ncbi:hypothetical protein GCM10009624_31060 [Gordonia sinesedis]